LCGGGCGCLDCGLASANQPRGHHPGLGLCRSGRGLFWSLPRSCASRLDPIPALRFE
jgi:hypothetical protein